MTTIQFTAAAANPELLADFDPLNDILLFTDQTAAELKVSSDASSTTLSFGDKSVTLDVSLKAFGAGTDSFIRFIDGSVLLIGDATSATVADDLANLTEDESSDGNDQIMGLGGNDTLDGGLGSDLIYGNAGDDYISADGLDKLPNLPASTGDEAGDDTVFGGQGDDYIDYYYSYGTLVAYGNLGDDQINAAAGDSLLYGGQGEDDLYGDDGNDTIYGNADDDFIYGGNGDNALYGGQGADTIDADLDDTGHNVSYGNLGDDLIYGGANGDTMYGGQGDDTLFTALSNDIMFGNAGNDIVYANAFYIKSALSGPIALHADVNDSMVGGEGQDTLYVDLSSLSDMYFLDFNGAEDVVVLEGVTAGELAANGYGGAITNTDNRGNLLQAANLDLEGENGTLVLSKAAGQSLNGDNVVLTDGTVFVYNIGGAAGSFDGGAGSDFMIAGDAGDTLNAGTGGADTLIGGDGNDVFQLNAGFEASDVLMGGQGDDTLTVTIDSDDTLNGGIDSIEQINVTWSGDTGTGVILLTQATDVAIDASSLTVGQAIYMNNYGGEGAVDIATGNGDDTFFLSAVAADTVHAGDGNDNISGNGGNDLLFGEAGEDIVIGGNGADTLSGGAGADQFYFAGGETGFTLATVDHITDFKAGEDVIYSQTSAATVFDERLVDVSGESSLADAAEAAYDASTGIDTGDAVLFVYGGRTYVFINDNSVGFSTETDFLIDITGFSGTLTANDFSAE